MTSVFKINVRASINRDPPSSAARRRDGTFHSRCVFPAGSRAKINETADLPKLVGRVEVGIKPSTLYISCK